MKRGVICAMIGLMILFASCAAIKPLRAKIVNAIVEWYTDYVAMYFESGTTDPILRKLTYVPEKYSVFQESILENYSFIRYSDDDGNLLTFTCEPSNSDVVLYDYERHNIEQIEINGSEGLYFVGEAEVNFLTWEEDGYTYSVSGICELSELIKMAESLK